MATSELQRQIERVLTLNRVDCESAKFDEIKESVSQLMHGLSLRANFLYQTDVLFRCRVMSDQRPLNIKQLGPPPSDLVIGYQRCNRPGRPVFYLSGNEATALTECRVRVGDSVVISSFRPKNRIPVFFGLYELCNRIDSFVDMSDVVVLTFFDTIFTRRIHQDFSNDYMVTAAIAEVMLAGFADLPTELGVDSASGGFAYPSVLNRMGSLNFAFDGSLFEHFSLEGVARLRVSEIDCSGATVEFIESCRDIDQSTGRLTW